MDDKIAIKGKTSKKIILPPCQIIGQFYILRQTVTINFTQENM
jgi:hypothetical protein